MAIVLGIMSAAILLAEATLLPSGVVDLSLFSILINSVRKQEALVQVDYNVLKDQVFVNIWTYCVRNVLENGFF